ncbi:MAG: ABC transporter permease, partial [Gemmatimonadaceae bacterium]
MTRTGVRSRLLHWPGRSATRIAADVDDELRFHLDARAAELIAAGAAPAEALAQARREFGDVEYTRRYCGDLDRARERDGRRAELLSELRQDVVYGWRQLRKAPVFTLVAVITLALGIGANTAIFSVVNGVLLRPLPFAAADGLVRIFSSAEGSPRIPPSPLDVADWRAASRAFATIAAYVEGSVTLTGDGSDAERLRGARVSASLLPTLGVRPLAGRTFAPREDTDPPPREVVLSEALWGRRFGGDASVLGREIALDGERYRVIGIVPRGAEYPAGTELWLPLDTPREMLAPPTRGARYLRVLARLAPGVTLAQGQAEMTAIAARIAAQYPEKNAGLGASVLGLREYTVGDVRRPLLVLLGAVGLVLLIACANVANLLLVRA